MTKLSIGKNLINDEGVIAICEAIQSNKETKITELNFKFNGITKAGAKSVAAMMAATSSLTACDLRHNGFDAPAKQLLRDSVKGRPSFKLQFWGARAAANA